MDAGKQAFRLAMRYLQQDYNPPPTFSIELTYFIVEYAARENTQLCKLRSQLPLAKSLELIRKSFTDAEVEDEWGKKDDSGD